MTRRRFQGLGASLAQPDCGGACSRKARAVPASSSPISREKPATSAARMQRGDGWRSFIGKTGAAQTDNPRLFEKRPRLRRVRGDELGAPMCEGIDARVYSE